MTSIYCRVPARWGLQQTTLGSGQRQDTGSGILWSVHTCGLEKFKKKETARTFDPFLLSQGEPGTSQYIVSQIFERWSSERITEGNVQVGLFFIDFNTISTW